MEFSVKEISAKQVLTPSKLPGVDYSINPYVGCEHACPFCYAMFMKQYTQQKGGWGEFADVKLNSHLILRQEIKGLPPGNILMSSVTDPYMPIDAKYELTRKILEEFVKSEKGRKFHISILTRSTLCLRDIDLFQKLSCEVGFSISTLDIAVQKVFEPYASRAQQRLKALEELKKNKIKTFAFLSPILPYITEHDLEKLFEEFSKLSLDHIWVDKLNIKSDNWKYIEAALKKNYPDSVEKWNKVVFGKSGYWKDIRSEINSLSKKYGIKTIFCFN
ncbi:MAG: radical SAM protein [Candidatus Aenigmarchaeota archaeon]|nr:radical SAM protein [Candidatus Aenigmarchaeota archaeon]